MSNHKVSCSRKAADTVANESTALQPLSPKEEISMIKVGGPAPDFTAPAFYKGEFTEITLSDFTKDGKWVYICFYPGDFTFV